MTSSPRSAEKRCDAASHSPTYWGNSSTKSASDYSATTRSPPEMSITTNRIEPGWFSIPGAAVYTGFSVSAIESAVRLGKIQPRPVRIKGTAKSRRLKRAELDAWIESEFQQAKGGDQ